MPSSPSTSSNISTENPENNCKICQVPAHGQHFGVLTCRACAAFFRRTIVENRENKYLCRKDDNNCSIVSDDRYHCKSCRFKKCVDIGMSSENVQRHRDTFNNHINRRKNLKRNSIKIQDSLSKLIINPKKTIDVSSTKKEICKILNDKSLANSPDLENLNSLERAEYGLRQWRKKQKPIDKMDHLVALPIIKLFGMFKNQMLEMAKWLSYSKDFQKLDEDQKYQFFKLVWNIWRKFERYQISLELFGEEAVAQEKFALTDQHYVSISLQLQFSEISNESDEKLTKCFKDAWRGMFGQVAGTLLDLEPTSTEMAFMLSEICWQIAGKSMQGPVLELSEKVRDELADNLHVYYKGSHHQNYAARLIRLSRVVNSMVKFHTELKNRMEIVRIFEVFSVDLSEPDLYDI